MPSSTVDVEDLKKLIVDGLGLEGIAPDSIETDAPLFGSSLGLDSVDALELVVVMEKAYGIKIESHEVGQDEFASVAQLAAFLERKLSQDGEPAV